MRGMGQECQSSRRAWKPAYDNRARIFDMGSDRVGQTFLSALGKPCQAPCRPQMDRGGATADVCPCLGQGGEGQTGMSAPPWLEQMGGRARERAIQGPKRNILTVPSCFWRSLPGQWRGIRVSGCREGSRRTRSRGEPDPRASGAGWPGTHRAVARSSYRRTG